MSTYLWGATVLREFCSSTRLPFFQKRRGSRWSHERTPHQRLKSMLQYICQKNIFKMCGGSAPYIWSLSPENSSGNLEKHFGGRDPASAVGAGRSPHQPHRDPQTPWNKNRFKLCVRHRFRRGPERRLLTARELLGAEPDGSSSYSSLHQRVLEGLQVCCSSRPCLALIGVQLVASRQKQLAGCLASQLLLILFQIEFRRLHPQIPSLNSF